MTSTRQQAARISELSFNMRMTQARAQLAQDRERDRARAAEARFAALQPLLKAAGYGPHGDAPRLRAEARAVRAASRSAVSDECSGPDCRVCAQETARRMDAARRGEITR